MKRGLFTGRLRPPTPIQPSEYVNRRNKLVDQLTVDRNRPFVLLRSNQKTFSAPDVPHTFRQCSHLRYLTGCLEPSSCLVINENRSTLFVHVRSSHEQLWEGEGKSMNELKAQANLDEVLPLTELPLFLAAQLKPDSLLADDPRKFEDVDVQTLIDLFPGGRTNLFQALDTCRWIKSEAEVGHMRHAALIGSETLNSVIQRASKTENESILVGMLDYEVRLRGADSLAYPPVVACNVYFIPMISSTLAGKRANTIHYIDANQASFSGF